MSERSRIEELQRRVQRDPASIAFAQLAEEHRRAGQLQDAVDVARAGLVQHPAYLSARVTLGRALLELGQLEEAAAEFEYVVQAAPDNLTAVRQLAEIHQKRRHLTNETKRGMPEVPSLSAASANVARPVPPSGASSSATTSDTAKQEVNTAKQEINTAKQEINAAQQPPSPPPQFVVELTSQTAHVAAASPLTSTAVPAVPPSAPPPGATSPPAAVASVAHDIADPPAPAPLDPVIAELQAWLAVLEDERAGRVQSPHASR